VKLQTVQVTNFRSVEDSEVFELGGVTCLVGKNESGKSAILLALAALNPHSATPAVLDKERDYPRRLLTQYSQRHRDKEAVAVKTTWKLEGTDLNAIAAEVGEGVVASDVVTVSRRYNQAIEVEVNIDFKPSLEFLYKKFALDASERSVLASANTSTELISALPKLASPTAKHQQLQAYLAENGPSLDACTSLSETRSQSSCTSPHTTAWMELSSSNRPGDSSQTAKSRRMNIPGVGCSRNS
jgi:energy-coupling factor transporter ATP-binding protein EcfA2